jgi:hypothetical protein
MDNESQADGDGDFSGDACDNCPGLENPTQADHENDGAGDVCDTDDDDDGVADLDDNCPLAGNPPADCDADSMTPDEQCDADGDALGDACDPCTDTDGDGFGDPQFAGNTCTIDGFPADPENDADNDGLDVFQDNCPLDENPGQEDEDADGLGDVCDACPADPENDVDQDGICAGECGAVYLAGIDIQTPIETVLVESGATVKYLANSTDPGIAMDWTATLFDDVAWSTGTFGVGYEAQSGAENLIATAVPIGTRSVYTRATFDIANVMSVDDLWLGADYDDAFVAWINGQEVYRSPEIVDDSLAWEMTVASHESSNGSTPDYGDSIDVSSFISALENGTNVLAVAVWNRLPSVSPSPDLVLVPKLSMNRLPAMRYLANATDPGLGTTWVAELYDDSGWSVGSFGVGYDTAGAATGLIETEVPSGSYSVYTRTQFDIANPSVIDEIYLGVEYDDGFAAWINGTEVARSPEMPGGAPDWNTSAESHESNNGPAPVFDPYDISAAAKPLLQVGQNVLAIGVWNHEPTSSDLVLFPSLSVNGDAVDNCPYVANPGQEDTDNDGVGSHCDNCPDDFNPLQRDTNMNGVGDACESS